MNQKGWATTISDTTDQLIISSRRKIPTGNKIIMGGFLIFVVAYALFIGLTEINSDRLLFFAIVFGSVAIGIGLAVWIGKSLNKGTGVIASLILDKKSKTLSLASENFTIKTNEVHAITIIEETILLVKIPRLKLKLKDGEKTLLLNFESYTQAQEAKTSLEKYL